MGVLLELRFAALCVALVKAALAYQRGFFSLSKPPLNRTELALV